MGSVKPAPTEHEANFPIGSPTNQTLVSSGQGSAPLVKWPSKPLPPSTPSQNGIEGLLAFLTASQAKADARQAQTDACREANEASLIALGLRVDSASKLTASRLDKLDVSSAGLGKAVADADMASCALHSRADSLFHEMATHVCSSVNAVLAAKSIVAPVQPPEVGVDADGNAVGALSSSDVADVADGNILKSVAQDGTSVVDSIDAPMEM